MAEETVSANTSPEEAITVRHILPENAAFSINTASLTINAEGNRFQDTEAAFGTHLREAAAIVKELWNRG